MQLFDIANYEIPKLSANEFKVVKQRVGVFLGTYKTSCERVGLRTFSLSQIETYPIPIYSPNENLFRSVSHQQDVKKFIELDELYLKGVCGITHPFSIDITIRRRKVFLLKYGLGMSNVLIGERIGYQQNIVIEDSKLSLIQFAESLGLVDKK